MRMRVARFSSLCWSLLCTYPKHFIVVLLLIQIHSVGSRARSKKTEGKSPALSSKLKRGWTSRNGGK